MDILIADNVRFLRNQFGYTLEGLAEIINVTRQAVAKWESGESLPDITNCLRLSTLFKVSLDEFVSMPLRSIMTEKLNKRDDSHTMGTVDVESDGKIKIPDSVLDMFYINKGEKILLLAEKEKGIALVKCSQFEEKK